MLRPATPLSIIFFVAFVLLLLSTLSTPIIHAIPLASYGGYNFGFLGYCNGDTCSPLKIGYDTSNLFPNTGAGSFSLPSDTRHSLSSILIVHPIATFLVLVCFGLACAAHFHSPSHSPRYLLALLILTIPTLLITLLAFLVDILLFVPHLAWGGWIVLAATILVMASMVVTCAMRRTLVSRKARKKRIAENPDMNGEEYYNNLNQQRMMADSQLPRADSPPLMSGSIAADKGEQQFAMFEMKRQDTLSQQDETAGRRSLDDRTPLNPVRDPSIRSNSTGRQPYGPNDNARPMPPGGMSRQPSRDQYGNPIQPSRDQYGNPIQPSRDQYSNPTQPPPGAMYGDLPPPGLRHQGSQGSLGSNGSRGGYNRGRGGYGPPPRGYGPPRGGQGPQRGGYGPRGGYRGQGPPPGWNGRGRGGPPGGMMGRGGMPRPGPPPGYNIDSYYSAPPPTEQRGLASKPMRDAFVAGPAIGQAIEMDERTGASPAPVQQGYAAPQYGLHDSDSDVAGMINMQQDRLNAPAPHRAMSGESTRRSLTSVYSDNQGYVAPRAQWQDEPHTVHMPEPDVSPLETRHPDSFSSRGLPSSQVLPHSPPQTSPISTQPPPHAIGHHRGGSDNYYEDVDPRFAVDPASETGALNHQQNALPSVLTPGAGGYAAQKRMPPSPNHLHPSSMIPPYVSGTEGTRPNTDNSNSSQSLDDPAFEPVPDGARSPGEGSETSHFTSVSQRGINPNWRPRPGSIGGSAAGAPSSASAAQRRREDVILNANPDFTLPGINAGRGGRGRGGMRGGGGRPGPSSLGLTPAGRYPTDI